MYKAAENWTDSANGTYLQFTTTPIGTGAWAERMRIAPDGNVGIGTPAPAQRSAWRARSRARRAGSSSPTARRRPRPARVSRPTRSQGRRRFRAATWRCRPRRAPSSGVLTLGGQTFLHGYGPTTYPNTFVGPQAGSFSISGNGGNVGVGALALAANTTGAYNTAVGLWALDGEHDGRQQHRRRPGGHVSKHDRDQQHRRRLCGAGLHVDERF